MLKYSAAALLLLCSLCAIFFQYGIFSRLSRIYQESGSEYGEIRRIHAFEGRRFDVLEYRLDSLLPRTQAVALSPEISEVEVLRQRFSELLYPRRLGEKSKFVLNHKGEGILVAELKPGGGVFLAHPGGEIKADQPPEPPSVSEPRAAFLILDFLALAICISSLGWLGLSFFARPSAAESLMAGALLVSGIYTFATEVQIPVPAIALPIVGVASLLFLYGSSLKRRERRIPLNALLSTQDVFFAIAMIGFGFIHFNQPVSSWDARSIWFFHAKQIFYQGYLSINDLTNPMYSWSHADYPLLLPGWIAYFNSLFPFSFSERIGGLGIWALFSALSYVLWQLVRCRYGSLLGFLALGCVVFGVCGNIQDGLADGLLCLMILGAAISSQADIKEQGRAAWILLWAASMMKWEGLILSLGIAVLGRKWSKGLLGFLPALSYMCWVRYLHLPNDYVQGSRLHGQGSLAERSILIFHACVFTAWHSAFFASGVAAFAMAFAVSKKVWRTLLFRVCVFALLFTYVVFLFSPYDMYWHIDTAFERVLFYFSAFSILLVAEATKQRIQDRRNTGIPAPFQSPS